MNEFGIAVQAATGNWLPFLVAVGVTVVLTAIIALTFNKK